MYQQENSQKASQQNKFNILIKQMRQMQNELNLLQEQQEGGCGSVCKKLHFDYLLF
jgi:hypothetical protein